MQVVMVGSGKGGVAKSTTVAALSARAAQDGLRVCVADLDPTVQSLVKWIDRGKREDVVAGEASLATLADDLTTASEAFDLCFIDTPPRLDAYAKEAIGVADIVVAVMQSDADSIECAMGLYGLAKEAGKAALWVLTRAMQNSMTTEATDVLGELLATEKAEGANVDLAPIIWNRVAHQRVLTSGTAPTDPAIRRQHAKAAEEVDALWGLVRERLGLHETAASAA